MICSACGKEIQSKIYGQTWRKVVDKEIYYHTLCLVMCICPFPPEKGMKVWQSGNNYQKEKEQ